MTRRALFPACLAAAAVLHALPFLTMREGGTRAAGFGSSGSGQVTLAAASEALAQQVSDWTRPPEIHTPAPAKAPAEPPRQPVQAAAPAAPSAPHAPAAISSPVLAAAPAADTAPARPVSPPPPPPPPAATARAPSPAPSTESVQEQAVGSSSQQAKGDDGADAATTGDTKRTASLKNRWGAAIISRIERQKRPPRGGGEGTVRLHLTVSTQGRLMTVSITRSSGNAEVDQAAVAAVKRARVPRAPKALTPGSYSFTFQTTFIS
mgnify:CR=1 FL=1